MRAADRIIILGAGPTGLGAAYRLKQLGASDFHVFDAASHVGGLAASHRDEKGFTWDIGGHVQFSHYRYFDELMGQALGDRWLHHQRESWVWMEDRFIPYPFQNNIRRLTPESRWKCLQGLVRLYKQPPARKPANFHDWIMATFGNEIADIFMLPYNFKVWAYPPETMDYGWVGERVAVTDLERVLDNVLHEKDDLSWGPNNTFQFPASGGTGAIWESVAGLIGREHFTLGAKAVRVDAAAKQVHFASGEVASYDRLISTLPLDRLVAMSGLDDLAPATAKLRYSSSHIIGIGLRGRPPDSIKTKCWMYFPESNCPFYRVTVFSNYSPQNVPDASKYWSLMAEVSESPVKPVDGTNIVRDTIAGLRNTRLIDDASEVVSTWYHRAHHGYPTPSLDRDKALEAIHPRLEQHEIYSRGRFGGWKYEVSNQDHSLMQGVELINRLALGVPEVTYPFPNTANNMKYAK